LPDKVIKFAPTSQITKHEKNKCFIFSYSEFLSRAFIFVFYKQAYPLFLSYQYHTRIILHYVCMELRLPNLRFMNF